MNRSIIAVTRLHHGLGNRIRVVLSAQDLAESTGRDFAYVWPTGRAFGARLDDLWQADMRQISVPRSRMLAIRHPYRDASADWRMEADGDAVWQIRTAQPIVVDGAIDTWHPRLRRLRPVAPITERVEELFDAELRGRPYLGVMIRSHSVSHERTRAESPLEWYLKRIGDVRRDHPHIPVFVSADTTDALDQVCSRFDDVHAIREKGPYNSLSALRAAVVDLYMLASSTHILAPHYSSFPELARYLAGPEVRLETSMTGEKSRFDATALTRVDDPTRPFKRKSAEG
ncbi:hypothetical protein Q9R19_01755 [Microbacterium sp. ARD32]|uniref:hypothetical protein n=1 Tax=Microbacterium sp. ARD32 TaxID=2962577 RepID=UPI00288159B3|nr:hypothetical protein [Microbacterium sp. ARD32]MDT0156340.1 hypothetical protein [Microbacterium sp. ARD32]